jgi:hypothetical protein
MRANLSPKLCRFHGYANDIYYLWIILFRCRIGCDVRITQLTDRVSQWDWQSDLQSVWCLVVPMRSRTELFCFKFAYQVTNDRDIASIYSPTTRGTPILLVVVRQTQTRGARQSSTLRYLDHEDSNSTISYEMKLWKWGKDAHRKEKKRKRIG